ncbi:MAG: FHA domain-containing protein [Fimbriimonadaceae bacterium]|nr:FHA domain-containing protein [Fimbriimonadaceae bacterium]
MSDPNRTQLLSTDPNRTQMIGAPTVRDGSTFEATITIKPIQCPVCKTFNPAGVMFCVECGLIFDRALPDDAFGAPAIQLPCLVESSGREHPLRPGANVVGREGDVALPDPRVSRRHAQITMTNGALSLEDLGSTNGTTHNDARVEPGATVALAAGDTVAFGGYALRVSLPGEGQKTAVVSTNKTAAMAAPPRADRAAALLVGEEREYPLTPGPNTFGRKSDNQVSIVDPYVSGRHGLIEVEDDGVYLTDTGSTNGTVLNDAKLAAHQRTLLKPDDVIRLGSLSFRVRLVGGE